MGEVGPTGAVYFFLFAGVAVWTPYLALHLSGQGLPPAQVGLLQAVTPLVGLWAQPLFGLVADTRGRVRVLRLLLLAGALVVLLVGQARSLWWLGLGIGLIALTTQPAVPLADGLTMAQIQARGGDYGRLRVWGSIGYAAMVALSGWLLDGFGTGAIFPLYAATLLLTAGAVHRMVPREVQGPGRPARGQWQGLVHGGIVPLVLAVTFILMAANAGHYAFFSLYLEEVGASRTLMGVAWSVSALSEIPAVFWGGALIERYGPLRVLALAGLVYAVRYAILAVTAAPLVAVATQLLHSLSFGLMWPSLVLFMNYVTPPEFRTTGQGLMGAVAGGLAMVFGMSLAGTVVQSAGLSGLFQVISLLAAVAAGGYGVLAHRLRRTTVPAWRLAAFGRRME